MEIGVRRPNCGGDAQFLNIDPQGTPGFPGSLDDTKFGVRTDAGYRFGGFNGGFFFEPLATIGVVWSDIDSFSRDGNTVNFDDDANVRGRLGLRLGTSYEVWKGVINGALRHRQRVEPSLRRQSGEVDLERHHVPPGG